MRKLISVGMFLLLLTGVIAEHGIFMQYRDRETLKTTVPAEEQKELVAYLTFDDGPSSLTEKYLDILEAEQVKATFFLIGKQIDEEGEQTVKRALEGGHEIGIHTYSHEANSIYQSGEVCYQDIMKVREMLQNRFDYQPKLYRFPWGSCNLYVQSFKKELASRLSEQGIEYEDWNVSGEDSVGCPSADSILANVRKDYKKYQEPVILLHDSGCNSATLQALKGIIRELKNEGFKFDVLSKRSKPCHFGEYPL